MFFSKILQAYSLYLVVFAVHLAVKLYLQLTPENKQESIYAGVLVVLLLIHAKWHWSGASYFSFGVIALGGRIVAGLVVFIQTSEKQTSLDIPHVSVMFGWAELGWALLLQTALIYALLSKKGSCRPRMSLRGANRMGFGVYLVLLGCWLLRDSALLLRLLGLPPSEQKMFTARAPHLDGDPLHFLRAQTPAVRQVDWNRGLAPFPLAAAFTQLLGLFNIAAGLFGLEDCLRAGEQGGLAFSVLCIVLVIFRVIPMAVLVIPALDVLSIIGLHVHDLHKEHSE